MKVQIIGTRWGQSVRLVEFPDSSTLGNVSAAT